MSAPGLGFDTVRRPLGGLLQAVSVVSGLMVEPGSWPQDGIHS